MFRTTPLRALAATVLAGTVAVVAPGPAWADEFPPGDAVVIQANVDVTVPADTHRDVIVVFSADATILGEVDTVVVLDGTATVSGGRVESLVVAGGTADVGAGSTVGDVRVVGSVYHVSPEATVRSYETIEPALITAALAPVALAVWVGFAIAYVLAGLAVAAIGGRQLRRAGEALSAEPGTVLLAALGVLIGLPLLAGLLMVTVIGLPTGLAILLVALPVVWFVGSMAIAVRIGDWILLRIRGRVEATHPILAAFIGIVFVGVVSAIPVVGFLLGLAGAGAVALVAWRSAFGGGASAAAPTTQPGPVVA